MLTTKSVQIFDVEKITLNSFITFEVYSMIEDGGSDDLDNVFVERFNGIITKVSEEYIQVMTANYCPVTKIHVSDIKEPNPRIIINGIRSSLYYD